MQGKREIISVIKEARKRCAMSQTEFGRLIGTSFMTVQRYELGKRRVSKTYFEKCKNLLKTPMGELSFLLEAFHKKPVYFEKDNSLRLVLPRVS